MMMIIFMCLIFIVYFLFGFIVVNNKWCDIRFNCAVFILFDRLGFWLFCVFGNI